MRKGQSQSFEVALFLCKNIDNSKSFYLQFRFSHQQMLSVAIYDVQNAQNVVISAF